MPCGGFVFPVLIPAMEIPTAVIALTMLGFELVSAVSSISDHARSLNVDQVMVNKAGLKVGLRTGKNGKLELVIDEEQLRKKEGIELKDFKKQLQHKYAYARMLERLKAQGYSVVEEENIESKRIRLVVRRWR
jgi:lauroyl/myristoyl acyltransferase